MPEETGVGMGGFHSILRVWGMKFKKKLQWLGATPNSLFKHVNQEFSYEHVNLFHLPCQLVQSNDFLWVLQITTFSNCFCKPKDLKHYNPNTHIFPAVHIGATLTQHNKHLPEHNNYTFIHSSSNSSIYIHKLTWSHILFRTKQNPWKS